MAHRLELAIKDTFKAEALHKALEKCMKGLYTFYHKSAVNRSGLTDHFSSLEITCKYPRRIGGTRWVAHTLAAVDVLIHGYKAIKEHVTEVNIHHTLYIYIYTHYDTSF